MLELGTVIILSLYTLLIGVALLGWLLSSPPAKKGWPQAGVSVIIPARDEAHNLPALLHDLAKQTYSNFVVIVVDDHSSDQTANITRNQFRDLPTLNGKLLQLHEEQGKKAALELGIRHARDPLIVTTDADCRVGTRWIEAIVNQSGPDSPMILGPVAVAGPSPLGALQEFDMMILMLFTAASARFGMAVLSNGANLVIARSYFESAGGYGEHKHISSGDDVLLMQRIARTHGAGSIRFNRQRAAMVTTAAVRGLKAFLHQRARWLSKAAHMTRSAKVLMVVAYVSAAGLVASSIYALGSGSLHAARMTVGVAAISVTVVTITMLARFFHKPHLLIWSPLLVPIYLFYILTIPIVAPFVRPVWKDRPVRS